MILALMRVSSSLFSSSELLFQFLLSLSGLFILQSICCLYIIIHVASSTWYFFAINFTVLLSLNELYGTVLRVTVCIVICLLYV